jgi:mRNA interferase MazF
VRAIHLASLDKMRPVLVLTREAVLPYLNNVTVAPITSTIRGLSTELHLGPANGLDHDCVVSLDNVATIPVIALGAPVGFLLASQEPQLHRAIAAAFDLESQS